jgi:hypothetical protein
LLIKFCAMRQHDRKLKLSAMFKNIGLKQSATLELIFSPHICGNFSDIALWRVVSLVLQAHDVHGLECPYQYRCHSNAFSFLSLPEPDK